MAVLERSELEASPLADLHTIANQVGLDGFRRLRKADLIDAILGEASSDGGEDAAGEDEPSESAPRARKMNQQGHELPLLGRDLKPGHGMAGGFLAQPAQDGRFAQRDGEQVIGNLFGEKQSTGHRTILC